MRVDQGLPTPERYAQLLERVRTATLHHLGAALLSSPPATASALESVMSLNPPATLTSLYRVTDGLQAFDHWFTPLSDLVELQEEILRDLQDYELPELRGLKWGPEPTGEVLALSAAHGAVLLLQTSGEAAGSLTNLNMVGDSGFRYVGPSIASMLDAWARVAEAGYIKLDSANVVTTDDSFHDAIRSLLQNHPCTPAAVGILDPPK